MNNIDELIQQEIKSGNKFKLETYRAIKAEFLKAKTEKNAKELDEVRKLQILQKMIKQREDSADQYIKANRLDLAADEKAEIAIIAEFLPEEVTKEEIEQEFEKIAQQYSMPVEQVKEILGKDLNRFASELRSRKINEFIVTNNSK